MLRAIGFFALCVIAVRCEAFFDPPTIVPANPAYGQLVSVSIRGGGCDQFDDLSNQTDISRTGNAIRIIIDGSTHEYGFPCPGPSTYTVTYPLGYFEAGNYTVEVIHRYEPYDLPPRIEERPIGSATFTVAASAATPVPTLQSTGLAIAIVLVALVGGLRIHARRGGQSRAMIFMILITLPGIAVAESAFLFVELEPEPTGPAPETVVEDWDFASPPAGQSPPIAGLAVGQPMQASYLIPLRTSGAALAYLQQHPTSPRAVLERTLLVEYPDASHRAAGQSALDDDPEVGATSIPADYNFAVAATDSPKAAASFENIGESQYFRTQLNVDQAWMSARGYAQVGIADSGIDTTHPALAAFSASGNFLRGNFAPALSADVGDWPNAFDVDVEEGTPMIGAPSGCDVDEDGFEKPDFAGHGTHVAGLIAGNPVEPARATGVCVHCTISVMKVAYPQCKQTGSVVLDINSKALATAVTMLTDAGAQVISLSFTRAAIADYCTTYPLQPDCVALAHAHSRGVTIVSASGNARSHVEFPGSDSRVAATGGIDASGDLWNEDRDAPPNHLDGCPKPGSSAECGSNFTVAAGDTRRQEEVASADQVMSTTYRGLNWNDSCGDLVGGSPSDGYGVCTGTSMSAPLLAGIAGIVRSVNPLVGPGNPELPMAAIGVRDVLSQTSSNPIADWTPQHGFGTPDAHAAVRRMLGTVGGLVARTRLTPMFAFHSAAANDHAYTTSVQAGAALLANQSASYQPVGANTTGFTAFPVLSSPQPRAEFYVFTTHLKPVTAAPNLQPIYWLERSRYWPLGCVAGTPGCNAANRDFLLATSTNDLEALVAQGYGYRGMQGYVYAPCAPEPGCIPAGAEKLHRQCNAAIDDCAIFLESARESYEVLGYANSPATLGYAYPNLDADADQLIDGLERVIGTNPLAVDSDGDGAGDGIEYPLAAPPMSDPCSGLTNSCSVALLFENGFE